MLVKGATDSSFEDARLSNFYYDLLCIVLSTVAIYFRDAFNEWTEITKNFQTIFQIYFI